MIQVVLRYAHELDVRGEVGAERLLKVPRREHARGDRAVPPTFLEAKIKEWSAGGS